MKIPPFASVVLAAVVSLPAAPQVGDAYEKVIAEKGAPIGVAEAGGTKILRYRDQTIKLRDGHVVTIDATAGAIVSASAVHPRAPAKTPTVRFAEWTTDYAAALEQARQQGRHVFLFFTGSDWCGWCKRLNQEILSTPEFARYAGENLILVELDFPRGKPQPKDLVAQNARLARQYRIRGYPTVVVLDSAGQIVGHLGYQEGGPAPFVDALRRM
ncbi:MAG TPA: thioredoxin family protein [Opitutaceae bacterium]|nr:thioredoxin family protein [Opitutaceae bacterium]